ncbi:MAG: chemotaxis response regulator protein-glutamate methylesterase [Alphaproteobacteria bacterium GWF2_58_20]|nr:MAG: chemotaxis response regulator protein-glutamate methylesterase [Alphaproteobacteria bacterium GWF2_58_20]
MVVDDSAIIRGLLTRILESDPAIRVISSVSEGQMALNALKSHVIDVIVLDIEMPGMDGMTALPKLIESAPQVKVIMTSTLTRKNAEISLRALEMGAADYISKPSSRELTGTGDFQREIITKVKALAMVARTCGSRRRLGSTFIKQRTITPPVQVNQPKPALSIRSQTYRIPSLIAIGSSTGGPQALFEVLRHFQGLPQPIIITQHMPPTFTAILADHIQKQCGIPCAEGRHGEPLVAGRIYIAPGDTHMTLSGTMEAPIIRLNKEPPENYCRPSVDPMMRSAAKIFGNNMLSIILTGMGQDGMLGCKQVVESGGMVIAQDEASSVVWGMPGAVAQAGLCSAILPLTEIGPFVSKKIARRPA